VNKFKILVVDDEKAIRDMVKMTLELMDFICIEAPDTRVAMEKIVDEKPDVIVLDWMLPEVSGLEFTRRLKREGMLQDTPVILLTAKAEEDSRILGLESGADDYITKPFSTRELIARIKAVLRRQGKLESGVKLTVGDLIVEPLSHRVTIGGEQMKLGPIEYRLLHFFLTHQDRAYSRAQLLDKVWGGNVYVEERTVDVHIRRLRKAIEKNDCHKFIQTVRGMGYMFSAK